MYFFRRCLNGCSVGVLLALMSACNVQVTPDGSDTITVETSGDANTGTDTSTDDSSTGDGTATNSNSNTADVSAFRVDFVSPYVELSGESQEVIIRGSGFVDAAITSVSFGETLATEIDVRSNTEIRATYPVMEAGTYAVEVASATETFTSSAELVVVDPELFTGAAVITAGVKSNLVYDAERKAIYTADYENGELEKLQLNDGSWNADNLELNDIRDLALSPNGNQIIAVTPHAIVHINADNFSVEQTVAAPEFSDSAIFLDNIAIANNGVAVVSLDSSNGTSTGVYAYSLTDNSFAPLIDAGGPWELAATTDGSKIIIAAEPTADATVYEYLAASGEVSMSALDITSLEVVADRSGEHFLMGDESGLSVYDSELQLVGGNFSQSSAFSPDGNLLYVYTAPSTISVYDLTSLNADTGFALLGTFELSSSPGSETDVLDTIQQLVETAKISITVTPDNQNLILSGSASVVIVPIPELTVAVAEENNTTGDSTTGDGTTGDSTDVCTTHCDRPWEAIVDNIIGFGEGTTGGMGAELCHVTNLKDSGTGSLRACAEKDAPAWIVFDVSGVIKTSSSIDVQSNKTIDGRGQKITLTNYGLLINNSVKNIIVHNIRFDGAPSGTERDGITVYGDVRNVWIDHCDFARFTDGLVDITVRSSDITVSWSQFWDHDKGVLISASDSHTFDSVIRVSMHHNYFHDIHERTPRVRFGKVHVFNNYMKNWGYYGVRSAIDAQVVVENNIFEAGSSTKAIEVIQDGAVRASDNLLLNGALTVENKASSVFDPAEYYSYTMDKADNTLKSRISTDAGWQDTVFPNL